MDPSSADINSFVALLALLRSPDNTARTNAEKQYREAQSADPGRVLLCLAACLGACKADDVARTQAVTLLRRAVVHTGSAETTWSKAAAAVQAKVRVVLFQALDQEPNSQVRKVLIAAIATVAGQTKPEDPWNDLVSNTFALAKSPNVVHQESALFLLAELIGSSYTEAIFAQQQHLMSLVDSGLQSPSLAAATLAFFTEMVGAMDSGGHKQWQGALPKVELALKNLAESDATAFEDAMQSLVGCVELQAAFFKPRFREWVELMFAFAGARGSLDEGKRTLAFEFVSTIAESKAKLLLKAVPNIPEKALEMAFTFLAEVEEDEAWPSVDEDEEGDEDESLHFTGEGKVDFFVKTYGFQATCKPLSALIQHYGLSNRWEWKIAAAMAIRASVEYVDSEATLDGMAKLLLQLSQDAHMRVRYAALFALGQMCHDQEAEFHSRWHTQLLPVLIRTASDPVDRVAAMAIGGLDAHIAELDETELADYAQQIVETLVSRLGSSSHNGVLVACMEALGALALGLEGSFDRYFDKLMPMLLAVVTKQGVQQGSTSKLRGKAFECISLLGYSVGKERFAPAAQQTMQAMLSSPTMSDDIQTDCMRQAMERICKVLGSDFAPFLPQLLPGLLASLSLESVISAGSADDEEDEGAITVPTDDGLMKVKTSQIEEILALVGLLQVLIKETGTSFLEYVRPTAVALAKILGCADSVLHLASSVRDAIYPCWAELVSAVSKVVQSHGKEAESLVVELVQQFVDKVGSDICKAEEADDIAPMAQGVASVVSNAGEGCLQAAQVKGICELAISEILKSFQREKIVKDSIMPIPGGGGGGAAVDDEDDEDEDGGLDGEEDDEKDCRVGLAAMCGACMRASPEAFVSHSWPPLQALMQEWLSSQEHEGHLLGLHLARDLCENLGERGKDVWPVFMGAVFQALGSIDDDRRSAAALVIKFAGRTAPFGVKYAAEAFPAVASSLKKFKAKKNDEEAQQATDDAVCALVELCLCHPGTCPDLDGAWALIFERLPLKADLEESRKLNRKLFIEAQVRGAQGDLSRTAQLLGHLCEVYGRSEHCDEDLQIELAKSFASLPQNNLQALVSQFTPKQQKKAERILKDAQTM